MAARRRSHNDNGLGGFARYVARDAARGALLGDLDPNLGLAGTATQIALSYVPFVGTVANGRDLIGDWRNGNRSGAVLSALAMVPVAGGLAKTFAVARNTNRIRRALTRR